MTLPELTKELHNAAGKLNLYLYRSRRSGAFSMKKYIELLQRVDILLTELKNTITK